MVISLLQQKSCYPREDEINDLAVTTVDKYVSLPRANDSTGPEASQDWVQLYASEVLSLGLLWYGYHDASREGDIDGERILNYWKFLLVLLSQQTIQIMQKKLWTCYSTTRHELPKSVAQWKTSFKIDKHSLLDYSC